jgi:prepilin-type N-terminal cleavage/methylation domain-containing protein
MRKRTRCKKGFTLLEILTSVVILSVGSVFVLRALAQISHTQLLAENRNHAYIISMSKMAELEAEFVEQGDVKEVTSRSARVNGQRFRWQVTKAPYQEELGLHEVKLTVTWKQGGDDYQVGTSTLIRIPVVENAL